MPGPKTHPNGQPRRDRMHRLPLLLNEDGSPRREFYGRGCAVLDVDGEPSADPLPPRSRLHQSFKKPYM